MKVLIVGSGGREHAIAKKVKENSRVTEVFALPGNGGMASVCTCVPIDATDLDGICAWVQKNPVDFAIIGPDDPLVLGCVDRLSALGIPCFGPNKKAAIIEGSKVFAKKLMKDNHIPTADYQSFDNPDKALDYVKNSQPPLVIKADGLALGKGVIIAKTVEEALDAVKTIMLTKKFGHSGDKIVIEEFLEGPEVTVLAFTDGKTIKPMVSSMDHKTIGEDNTGPNTGGMGVIAPNPYYTDEIAKASMETIFLPTIKALNDQGRTFKGCLYFGLMLTKTGPKVIEYNCRFGDPEAQAILPLLNTDLLEIMEAVACQKLDEMTIDWKDASSCCVVAASSGYPLKYETGYQISYPSALEENIFISGASLDSQAGKAHKTASQSHLITTGGRVLSVTATKPTLPAAIKEAYSIMEQINFHHKYCRSDIGKSALKAINPN